MDARGTAALKARRASALAAGAGVALLLAGPPVLAFLTGGYPEGPRAWAGLAAWVLAAAGLLSTGLPRGGAARLALAALTALALWTLASAAWAPVAADAWEAGRLALLYAGALLAAATLLAAPAAGRWVEPALVAGALVVVAYGLSERLAPGLVDLAQSYSAQGRLEQPITYWNAMGLLAGLGFVLAVRVAGHHERPSWLRSAAAAAAVPLALGLWLTVSRGALFAAATGLLALLVAAARREQLHAALLALAAGAVTAAAAAPFDGVTGLLGESAERRREGATVAAVLAAAMVAAALGQRWLARRPGASGPLRLPPRAPALALAVVLAALAAAVAAGVERGPRPLTPGAERLTTVQTNRHEYWRVAGRAFADHPLRGTGAGGWAVRWRQERPFLSLIHI